MMVHYRRGAPSVEPDNKSLPVTGLAKNMVLQGAGTYNATDILGYRVVEQGSTAWTLDSKEGASISVPETAFVTGAIYPEHLESITVGTGGQVILYIP